MNFDYLKTNATLNELYNKLAQARQEIENASKGVEAKQFFKEFIRCRKIKLYI